MYADTITDSIDRSSKETLRRRERQNDYNTAHGITPKTIQKNIRDILASIYERDYADLSAMVGTSMGDVEVGKLSETIAVLEKKMLAAADDLKFEEAMELRDEIKRLKKISMAVG
jgi:excinuclease ABC subunit B